MFCSFSGHRGRRRATTRRSPFANMQRRARGQAPARPLAASMHSTMASGSRTRQGRRFREVRIGASGGDVVEQKIRFPAGDRSHELQARLSAKGEDGLANFEHGTWDMGSVTVTWLGALADCWKTGYGRELGASSVRRCAQVAVPAAGVPCGWLAQLPQRTWVPQGLRLLAVRLPVDAARSSKPRYCYRFHIPQ